MQRALVVGYGNVYRRDDGVGCAVAQALCERLYGVPFPPDEDGSGQLGRAIDVLRLHQMVPHLAETISHYPVVVFVDARATSLCESIQLCPVAAERHAEPMSHCAHPASLLALTRRLYDTEPLCFVCSVAAHDLGHGEGLSAQTSGIVPQAVERILGLLSQRLEDSQAPDRFFAAIADAAC